MQGVYRREASMPFSILDLVVIGIVLISALLAMVRGFTRERSPLARWSRWSWRISPIRQAGAFVMEYAVNSRQRL